MCCNYNNFVNLVKIYLGVSRVRGNRDYGLHLPLRNRSLRP